MLSEREIKKIKKMSADELEESIDKLAKRHQRLDKISKSIENWLNKKDAPLIIISLLKDIKNELKEINGKLGNKTKPEKL